MRTIVRASRRGGRSSSWTARPAIGRGRRWMTPWPRRRSRTTTVDDAVRQLREDPAYAGLVRDAYLGRDVGIRLHASPSSAEFEAVRALLHGRMRGSVIVDLGAGIGMASSAFLRIRAGRVIAIEPDPSEEVGRGAMIRGGVAAEILDASGEDIPLPSGSIDIVYARQVLHHARDLDLMLAEGRARPAPRRSSASCREHVVDDDIQLQGVPPRPSGPPPGRWGERICPRSVPARHRTRRPAPRQDAGAVGLDHQRVSPGPLDGELRALPAERLRYRFGPPGTWLARVPAIRRCVWSRVDRPYPGRLYSFLATKP